MTHEKPPFIYEDIENQEKPRKVFNTLKALGYSFDSEMDLEELSGKESVKNNTSIPLSKKDCPNIVFGIPHAGECAPEEIEDKLTEDGKETIALIDLGTSKIFGSDKIPNATFLFSRYFIDPNRVPDFNFDKKTENSKALGNILWTESFNFTPMYKEGQEPNSEYVKQLAEDFYIPYYKTLMGAVGTLADRRKDKEKERILFIDGHSFPTTDDFKSTYDHYDIEDPEKLPMFILGTRDGVGCDEDIIDAFEKALKNNYDSLSEEERTLISKDIKGELFGRNLFLKGVQNVKFFGEQGRKEGVNAIQIECNERAYIDRPKNEKWEEFSYNEQKMAIMHKLIEKSSLDIDPLLKGKTK